MPKDGKTGSLTGLLLRAGEAILFRPESEFSSFGQEDEKSASRFGTAKLIPYKRKIKTALAKTAEQSFFLSLLRNFIRSFFNTRIRSFGILFFSFGFLQILSFFLSPLVPYFGTGEDRLLFGGCVLFLALVCTLSRGDVGDALKRSLFFRRFLNPMLDVKEWELPHSKAHDSFWPMLLTGILFSVISFLFSPLVLVISFAALAIGVFVLSKPEAGLILAALSLSSLPFWAFCTLLALTFFSFLFKCAVGRRSLSFSLTDLPVLLALIPLSHLNRWGALPLFLGTFAVYYLGHGLVGTTRRLKQTMMALTLSALFCGFWICLRQGLILSAPRLILQFPELDRLLFFEATAREGALLAMTIPLSLGLMRYSSAGVRVICLLSAAVSLGAIYFVKEPALWLALGLGVAIWFLMSYRAALLSSVVLGLGLLVVLQALPRELLQTVFGVFGIGEEATLSVEGLFSLVSLADGFWGITFFLLPVLIFLIRCFLFSRKTTRTDVHSYVLSAISSAAVFLAVSARNLVFDHRIVVLFFLLIAFPTAALRACRREEVRLPY